MLHRRNTTTAKPSTTTTAIAMARGTATEGSRVWSPGRLTQRPPIP